MMKRMHPEYHIINYMDVKSIDEYSSKIESLGGKITQDSCAWSGILCSVS
jgi:predicted enzyme related to lactoylglutathione lyase